MGLFTNRYKTAIHIIQFILIIAVLILSAVRLLNPAPGAPRTRANTMALGMSAKSLIIMSYQVLSEHVRAFKKWASLKAYVILNALEIVFWAAVAFLMIQANSQFCVGLTCTLSWVIVVLAIILSTLASYMTVVTYLDFRHFKQFGQHRGSWKEEDQKALWPADTIMMQDRETQRRAERHTDHVNQERHRDHPSPRGPRSPGYPDLSNEHGVHKGRRNSVGHKSHTYEGYSHHSNRRHSGHPKYHHQPLQQHHHHQQQQHQPQHHPQHQPQHQPQQHHHQHHYQHHRRTSSQRRYYEERLPASPPRYPSERLLNYYSN